MRILPKVFGFIVALAALIASLCGIFTYFGYPWSALKTMLPSPPSGLVWLILSVLALIASSAYAGFRYSASVSRVELKELRHMLPDKVAAASHHEARSGAFKDQIDGLQTELGLVRSENVTIRQHNTDLQGARFTDLRDKYPPGGEPPVAPDLLVKYQPDDRVTISINKPGAAFIRMVGPLVSTKKHETEMLPMQVSISDVDSPIMCRLSIQMEDHRTSLASALLKSTPHAQESITFGYADSDGNQFSREFIINHLDGHVFFYPESAKLLALAEK